MLVGLLLVVCGEIIYVYCVFIYLRFGLLV